MGRYMYYRDCEGFNAVFIRGFTSVEFFFLPTLCVLCTANIIVIYETVKRQGANWTWTKFYMAVIAVMDMMSLMLSTLPNFIFELHLAWTYADTPVNSFVWTGNARLFIFVVVGLKQVRRRRQRGADPSSGSLDRPGKLRRILEAMSCVLIPNIVNVALDYVMYSSDCETKLSFATISIAIQSFIMLPGFLLQCATYIESNKAKRLYEDSLVRVRLPNEIEENETQRGTTRRSEKFEIDAELSLAKAIFANLFIYLVYILAKFFFIGIIPHLTGCLFPYVMALASELALLNFIINPLVYYKLWPEAIRDIKELIRCPRSSSET